MIEKIENNSPLFENRARDGAPKFSIKHRMLRVIWRLCWFFLASWTPVQFRRWRVFLLRVFGATIGVDSDVRKSAVIWYPPNLMLGDHSLIGPNAEIYNMANISIGDFCIISQGAFLCTGTHNIDDPLFSLVTKPILIGNYCWIAADAFVGPGVIMEEGAVLGARGVAFTRLNAWKVYSGNPAAAKRERKNFIFN